jgi:hypothetical protein
MGTESARRGVDAGQDKVAEVKAVRNRISFEIIIPDIRA